MRKRRSMAAVQGAPNSDINVTPLVDVVLVLLIIFMVVTPLLEKDIDVRVPETEDVETPDEVPQGQLVVEIDAAGNYKLNAETIPADQYLERMRRVLAAKTKLEDKVVFFLADDKANYGKLIAALDMTRQADPKVTLGMATEEAPPAPAAPAADPNAPPPPEPPAPTP
jgi:biopolymer transport protein ExbD/biopolymer transport protein TolR